MLGLTHFRRSNSLHFHQWKFFSTKIAQDSGIIQVEIPSNWIDIGLGQPSSSLLPSKEMVSNFAQFTQNNEDEAWKWLQYGKAQGSKRFRIALAQFLNHNNYYGGLGKVNDEHLFVTGGASAALQMICSLF